MASKREEILALARSKTHLQYRLDPPPDGITTIDCSLLVVQVAQEAGIPLLSGVRTAQNIRAAIPSIPLTEVLPGDLLFFANTYPATGIPGSDGHVASHVGFSLGRGTFRMIDAQDRSVPPDVGETYILTDYWQEKLISAGRLPGVVGPTSVVSDTLRGIDVASWQGSPDWDKVKATGVSFAFTKVTEDEGYLNPTFRRNWSEMSRVGIVRGAYHFARPEVDDYDEEADWFLGCIQQGGGLAVGDLLALDLESAHHDPGRWALNFLKYVEQKVGFRPIVYTGKWYIDQYNIAAYPELGTYPLWLAAYQTSLPTTPAPWTSVSFWQFSESGQVPGIVGNVDLDTFYGDLNDLLRLGKPLARPSGYAPPGSVGSGILSLMKQDGTEPACPSTWLPLGSPQATIEEAYGLNGTRYAWHLPTGKHWRTRSG